MSNNILVFGAAGMAGHVITLYLEALNNKYNVKNVCFRKKLNESSLICDVSDIAEVEKIIVENDINIIINCVGILNKSANDDSKNTVYVNTFFPKFLENIGYEKNIKIIHISTDCVFTGSKGNYVESSYKDEKGLYGLSKNLGEINNNKDLTFRTSIIGPELKNGTGLFYWFMKQDGKIKGYCNAIWTGVTTLELAKAIDKAIEDDLTGIYHLVNNKKISKYKLLQLFNEHSRNNSISIEKDDDYVCDKSLINTRNDFDFKISDYEEMILEMKEWMDKNKKIYAPYYDY